MDIISKRWFLIVNSLAEIVLRDFSKVKVKNRTVKVPRLKARRKRAGEQKKSSIPAASVIKILIKSALEKEKEEGKGKNKTEEKNSYIILKGDEPLNINGGYGTVSKGYGASPHTSCVDYSKLFSYLGEFRAQSGFEDFVSDSPAEKINRIMMQDNSFYFLDREIMDTGVRSIKYFTHGAVTGELSAVPMGGINSADWEKFKLWKIVDYVMFNLKMSTL